MDTNNVLSSYFMTVDMHRFALIWLVYSRNKFFRVGPFIQKKLFRIWREPILGRSKLNVTGPQHIDPESVSEEINIILFSAYIINHNQ